MKMLARLLVAMAALVAAGGTAVPLTAPVGKVVNSAKVVRASGNTGARVLDRNSEIFFLDRISTNATGAGEFEFSDGTRLAVGPSANLVVDKFVFRNKSSFQKLGLTATRGTFRWISGKSPSSAYQIKTPLGTMGIRGTAFDVTIRNGRVYVALISGSANFCAGSTCRTLQRSCDYIEVNGGNISQPGQVAKAFGKRDKAAQIFPYLADPRKLSSRFRTGGGNCFSRTAREDTTKKVEAAPPPTPPAAQPPSNQDPAP